MRLTSYDALPPRQKAIWRAARPLVPQRVRFFFEGSMQVRGQLWYLERKLLFETVLRTRPKIAFEIGTWMGGGSTLFIAEALFRSGGGMLHTVEFDRELYEDARRSYENHLRHLAPYVTFHHGSSLDVIPPLLAREDRCDLLFLDGAQNAKQTSRELEMFDKYLRPGSVLVAHDWDNEKMAEVRPRIESEDRFEIIDRLTGPHSVGMVAARVTGSSNE